MTDQAHAPRPVNDSPVATPLNLSMPVHEVLNKFVADTVVEKVKPHMSYITFKVFDWPGFEVLAPPQPAAETESTSNTT